MTLWCTNNRITSIAECGKYIREINCISEIKWNHDKPLRIWCSNSDSIKYATPVFSVTEFSYPVGTPHSPFELPRNMVRVDCRHNPIRIIPGCLPTIRFLQSQTETFSTL